jgi:hypothetical protein
LIHLVAAYRTLGYKEDVQETCGFIHRFHASAPGVGRRVGHRSVVRSIGLFGSFITSTAAI